MAIVKKIFIPVALGLSNFAAMNSSSAQAALDWEARYGTIGFDTSNAMAVDPYGNILVAGSSAGGFATLKYDQEGDLLWVAIFGNSAEEYGYGSAAALAIDGAGNACVTGMVSVDCSGDECTGVDYATVQYDAAGNELWSAIYDGPDHGADAASALAVDRDGNVYVTGCSSRDYATLKYDSNGRPLWVKIYGGPGNDYASAVALDPAGNIAVTGTSAGDYATIKYDSSGHRLWENRYEGLGRKRDIAAAVAADSLGNIFVTGSSEGEGTQFDVATLKYSPGGRPLWEARYNGAANWQDYATALAVDSDGNVHVTGNSWGDRSLVDIAILKYPASPMAGSFLRGDCDGDGQVGGQITDAVFLLLYSFAGGRGPDCPAACDVDGNGAIDGELADAIHLLAFNFLGGLAPVQPFPACGPGWLPTDMILGCSRLPATCGPECAAERELWCAN
ncbi:MAG: SBBP repeat-containing protein [Planctomycetes bacterium]|nr:SBBP repeat-containing protein [Planctomycetota bacterium]